MVYRLLGLLLKFFFVLFFIGNAKNGNLPSLTLTGRFLEKYFGYLIYISEYGCFGHSALMTTLSSKLTKSSLKKPVKVKNEFFYQLRPYINLIR